MKSQEQGSAIALIGERSLVIGFRLIGIENAFVAEGEEAVKKFNEIYQSGEYSLIMASESLKRTLDSRLLEEIEVSTNPLVVFIPLPGSAVEESVAVKDGIIGFMFGLDPSSTVVFEGLPFIGSNLI